MFTVHESYSSLEKAKIEITYTQCTDLGSTGIWHVCFDRGAEYHDIVSRETRYLEDCLNEITRYSDSREVIGILDRQSDLTCSDRDESKSGSHVVYDGKKCETITKLSKWCQDFGNKLNAKYHDPKQFRP